MDSKNYIDIYTDGACSGNPGKGGWGVYIENKGEIKQLNGSELKTTNNRMELTAVIKALEYFEKGENINLYTDSKYVMDGITTWIKKWKKNNWKTSQKQPVKNRDLWEILDFLKDSHNISWKWVKGHENNHGNEQADFLATSAIKIERL